MKSINPNTGQVIAEYQEHSEEYVSNALDSGDQAFQTWKKTDRSIRKDIVRKIAALLREKKSSLALLMSEEMGKPLLQGIAEVEKCASCCEYYADNADAFLKPMVIETDASESFLEYHPLGMILAVMPWNFPLWQVIRFLAPALIAGNIALLKHASNVSGCSLALEALVLEAGAPQGVFQSLLISSGRVESLIRDPRVKAVTLTGSEYAGRMVASQAGSEIKKTVLELGGSNPFLIMADADLTLAVEQSVLGRFQNNGQSCIAAKRILIERSIFEVFSDQFVAAVKDLQIGNSHEESTQIGPVVNQKSLDELLSQVHRSIAMGARILCGGKQCPRPGYFLEPTVLANISPEMPVFAEETFGPIVCLVPFDTLDEAIDLANRTDFGLGAAIFTQDSLTAERAIAEIHSSSIFVNGMVKSDPRLPFGGIERSGYGRELSHLGMLEFVNIKTVWKK